MSTTLRSPFPFALLVAVSLAAIAGPARSQEDGAPEAAAEEAQPAKPKPAPKRKAPPPKRAEEKPADAAPAAPVATPGTLLEPAPATTGSAQWPPGARTVSEGYGDWTMNCTREEQRTDCVVIQSQGDRRTGRRQFSVELRAPKDGRAEGLILMPFGLQIEPGVSFKLDDRALGKGAPYSSCISDGCLVPISLPTLATDAMKTGQNLTVSATKPDAKEPTVLTVPLSGFAAAFARAAAFGG